MDLPPSIAPWVGLLLFAASVPAFLRGVLGAVTALGLGSLVDADPASLVKDGLFAVGFGLLTGGGLVLFFRPTGALFLVLASPGLAVVGGVVCAAVSIPARRRAAREAREAESAGAARAPEGSEPPAAETPGEADDGPGAGDAPAAGDPPPST